MMPCARVHIDTRGGSRSAAVAQGEMPLAEADKVALACPPKWPSAAAALATPSPAPTGLAESQLAKKGSGTAGGGRKAPAAALKAKMAESAAAAAAAAKQRQMDKTISQKVSFFLYDFTTCYDLCHTRPFHGSAYIKLGVYHLQLFRLRQPC